MKKYIEENLSKKFICFNSILYVSLILFIYKKDEELRFYVNYRKLNDLSKKNFYLISLIQEIITQLINKKYFHRFNIMTTFNNFKMHFNNEKYIVFKTTFNLYMYNMLSFKLTKDLKI